MARTRYHLLPDGESLGSGVVIFHGSSHNIWKTDTELETSWEDLTEAEAQVEGLKMQPGTPMPSEVDTIRQRLIDDYGIDIKDITVETSEGTPSLYILMRDWTKRIPETWNRHTRPFDIRQWT